MSLIKTKLDFICAEQSLKRLCSISVESLTDGTDVDKKKLAELILLLQAPIHLEEWKNFVSALNSVNALYQEVDKHVDNVSTELKKFSE